MCGQLFDIIEEKKKHFQRLDQAYKKQKQTAELVSKTKDEILLEDAQQWEKGREQRVQNWRAFTEKKTKTIKKQKKYEDKASAKLKRAKFYEMKSAPVRPEQRAD